MGTLYKTTNQKKDTTVVKGFGLLASISLTNSVESNALDFNNFHPGLGVKFGLFNTITSYKQLVGYGAITWGANAVLEVDNIQLFNTQSNSQNRVYPATYGVEGHFNWFFNNKSNVSKRFNSILAFTMSIKRTINSDDLLNYQELSEVVLNSGVIALKDYKGKYGTIQRQNVLRISTAYPMYIGRFSPVPYVVYKAGVADHSGRIGASFNFLDEPFKGDKKFKLPSSIGVGIDWEYQKRFSSPNYSIKGTLSI